MCEVVALSGQDVKARRPSEIQKEASCRTRLPSAGEDGWLINEPCTTQHCRHNFVGGAHLIMEFDSVLVGTANLGRTSLTNLQPGLRGSRKRLVFGLFFL